MTETHCDLLVIGGGIHGVGVAQAGAAAGYRTILLEQNSLASGTSSRSSKLIHGGLRYLEGGHLGLVRESLRERELLIKLAPTLVHRQRFFIPVFKQTTRKAWQLRVGLTLYALLAGGRAGCRFRTVPRTEWDQFDGLDTTDLRKVFQYWDAQTDDRLLTEAVMRSAESLGATTLCPASFEQASIDENGCRVKCRVDGAEMTIEAAAMVNAAGPWANRVLSMIDPAQQELPTKLVGGTHLELPGEVSNGCYYLEVPQDRRAVFVMPWKGRTLLGTTEQAFNGDPAEVEATPDEVEYLLQTYRRFFPERDTRIIDQWAGLRVLPSEKGPAFKASRETQLPVDNERQPRLVSIFGGKLTGYRATALKVIAKLEKTLPTRDQKARTDELELS